MKLPFIYSVYISLLLPAISWAESLNPDDVLIIEPANPSMQEYPFGVEDDIEPGESDFEIINQILMSNNNGDRWATITIRNISSGQRIFTPEQIVAVFANGDKAYPEPIDIKLSGGETVTYSLYFGRHKFPIIYIYSRN